jgi:hypothetical protein
MIYLDMGLVPFACGRWEGLQPPCQRRERGGLPDPAGSQRRPRGERGGRDGVAERPNGIG